MANGYLTMNKYVVYVHVNGLALNRAQRSSKVTEVQITTFTVS